MKPGEDTLGDASQMLRDILQSKEKKLSEHIGDNNNTLKTFNADTSLKSFCAASDSDNQEMMNSLLRGKSSASSKPNSVDNDIHSDNYTNLSGDESDLDSPYGQIAPDDLHTKESDIDPDATSPAENVSTSDSKEAKRARVENILTTIRQSPQAGFDSLTQASYEMKRQKRKQLQPQQHDVKSLLTPDTKYRKMERMVLHEHIRQLQHQLKAVERSFHQICDSDEDDKDMSNGREGEDEDDDGVESPANGRSYSSFMQMSGAVRNKLPLTPMANGLSPRSYGREELGFTATPANLNFKPESDLSLEISIASKALKRDVQLSQNGDVPPSPADQQPAVRVPPTLKSEIIQAVSQVLDAVLEKHVTATQQPERAAPVQQTHRQQQQQQQNHHQQQQHQQQQHQQHPHQQHQKKEEFRQHHQPSPQTPRSKSERELLKEIPASYQSEKKPELIIPYTDHLNFLERFSSNRLSSEKFSAFEPLHRSDSDLCAPHSSAAMTFAPHYPYYMHAGILPQLFPVEPEQTEALPLVVSNVPKKKRTKVTDTRLSPRAKSALLQDSPGTSLPGLMDNDRHQTLHNPFPHYLSPMLPTSVAITNPSLHRSDIFSFPRFHDSMFDVRMSSPPAHERSSPKSPQDSLHGMLKSDVFDSSTPEHTLDGQPNQKTCTLTPMHLRKAKLMFFYTRYPNSGILKIYFPDVSFNKNNTAQLVKWFSNFREFFYIQMEKYARQAVADGCQHAEDLVVNRDSELFRHLNLHYNRNNQIEAPETFRNVVESTLREFFRAVVSKKDTESSWKKAIYKVIARMDEPLPEFFKSANWMEQLGDV